MHRQRSFTLWMVTAALAQPLTAHAAAGAAAAAMRSLPHVEWSKHATIYEVNIRQYTPEGTFAAFEKHLPRLRQMGVEILWLMPVQPIGALNRKGTLGSYYSIRDYTAINPEFGTLADFRHLVQATHAAGMHLILDWVANHTAFDHPWVQAHPDWYQKNAGGEIGGYEYDNGTEIEHWSDVVGLDYRQRALWPAMIEAMAFWVQDMDVDGFRCDVAMRVPTPFWQAARAALDRIKPVFMLAEAEDPGLHDRAFDMTYDWGLDRVLLRIAKGRAGARDLTAYLADRGRRYPADGYLMTFTSNHDMNSWNGSDTERYGDGFKAFAALAATLPGMPLIYGGQEGVLDKRLKFFEKDAIDWKGYPLEDFYTELVRLKRANRALWNGSSGGVLEPLSTGNDAVFAFRRSRRGNTVTVEVNLSAGSQAFRIGAGPQRSLAPWGYSISVRRPPPAARAARPTSAAERASATMPPG